MSTVPQRRVSVWIKSTTKFAAFAPLFQYTDWEQLVEYETEDLLTMGLPAPAAVPLSKIINKLKLEDGVSAASKSEEVKSKSPNGFQNLGWEEPSSLPFELAPTLKDVDCKFMTTLLRFRGLLGAGDEVVSMEEKGVGVTAGYLSTIKKLACTLSPHAPPSCPTHFVVKAWPEVELLPSAAIAGLFKADIKGYTLFEARNYFPRPDVYLATFDEAKARYGLIMADCDRVATPAVHEHPLNLDQVRAMIPQLVHVAVCYEGAQEGTHSAAAQLKHMHHWKDLVASMRPLMLQNAVLFDELVTGVGHPSGISIRPFEEDPDDFLGPFVAWQDRGLGLDFAQMFTRCEAELMQQVNPEVATCTLVHGDLRGDNLFFDTRLPHGWLAIDFQMNFLGPVVSDLAYVLMSGTVHPDVYKNHTDALIEEFYTEFMKRTSKYKDYTLEQCRKEFAVMIYVSVVYFFATSGLRVAAGGPGPLGSRAMAYEQLPPIQKRRRFRIKAGFMNWAFLLHKFGARQTMDKCQPRDVDFKQAFDYTKPRGPPQSN
jgi:hypothetical protein